MNVLPVGVGHAFSLHLSPAIQKYIDLKPFPSQDLMSDSPYCLVILIR